MGKIIDMAVDWLIDTANDDSHGYDQINRWGEDYDCSSLTIEGFDRALVEYGRPSVKKAGATYTGNMKNAFVKCGFEAIPYKKPYTKMNLQKGDIILNEVHHVVTFIGDNKCVSANINEKGTTKGGKVGDQTGREINVKPMYEYGSGWNYVLRLKEDIPYEEPIVIDVDAVNDFVERLYATALNRASDEGGKVYWVNQLVNQDINGGDCVKGFLFSTEFVNRKTTDEEFIKILYKTMFDRNADPQGYADWSMQLKNGTSRKNVVDGFIGSQEWSKTCSKYGIIPR